MGAAEIGKIAHCGYSYENGLVGYRSHSCRSAA